MNYLNLAMAGIMPQPMVQGTGGTREEWIAEFNEAADEIQNTFNCVATTNNFDRKAKSGSRRAFRSLQPIPIAELEIGATHRGRIVYCRIVTRVLVIKSFSVLVEDDSKLTALAVYGLVNSKELNEGRLIAIMEPFYKIRADGSEGIRVDDPSDLVFDVETPKAAEPTEIEVPPERVTV
jgi:hypothetical protein